MVDDHGAILMEALVRLDYQMRSRCKNTSDYHRPVVGGHGHAICQYCDRPISVLSIGSFVGWVEKTYLIVEWL